MMDVSDEQLLLLSEYLQKTLSLDLKTRKAAEQFLESIERNQHYALLLLYTIDKATFDMSVRISAAITFKNFIKGHWQICDEDDEMIISELDRSAIKSLILNMMVRSPELIKKQLSDAISIIGKYDFPDKWPNLLKEMIEKLDTQDFAVINGILYTAHSLFKSYRHEFKSQKLWSEIKFVLDMFTKPLTSLFDTVMTAIHNSNATELPAVYRAILLICKIFYSLNVQDLPEFFEENMKIYMTHFHNLLTYEIPDVLRTNSKEADTLQQIKSQICRNVIMYASHFEEEFSEFLPGFVTDIWNLLTSLDKSSKYDTLVSNALSFLATVAKTCKYQHLFADAAVLTGICEKVIVPNVEIRDSDEELFCDNPEEYIRRDMEGSDVDTRRRSACDLVKVLSHYFQARITEIMLPYVQEMLGRYQANVNFWKAKNAAICLVISLASHGHTEKHGVTQTNNFVNVEEFTQNHIMPELQIADVNAVPIVKADCIKYIMSFRTVLSKQIVVAALPLIIKFLQSDNIVVHTYAAAAIEKMFQLKNHGSTDPLFTAVDLNPLVSQLLNNLIGVISMTGYGENDYVMKAIMRTFIVAEEAVASLLPNILPELLNILMTASKNPCKPNFNHFLFETLALSVRIVYKINPAGIPSLESELFPVFQLILQRDITEFIPYTFQLLAQLLECRQVNDIPETYLTLYTFLPSPPLWESQANVFPLVKLLNVYIKKCEPSRIDEVLNLKTLLGIFQKLIASRMNDHEGFNLLTNLIEYCSPQLIAPYVRQIFILLFQRLTSSKTSKYLYCTGKFFCFYLLKYGGSNLIISMDSIQNRIFNMVVESVIIPAMLNTSNYFDVKIFGYATIKLLTEADEVHSGSYSYLWVQLLRNLLKLLESPDATSRGNVNEPLEVEDIKYDPVCSKLIHVNNEVKDLLPEVGDLRTCLAISLSKFSVSYPGKLPALISNNLAAVESEVLNKYLNAASVSVA